MTQLGYLALALVAGIFMPAQAGINAQLTRWTRDAILTAFISFVVGTLVLLLVCLARRTPLPALSGIGQTQPLYWLGGLLGAFFVSATIALAPRLGATTLMALLVAGQLVASVVLDHYGLLGFEIKHVSAIRLVGVCLLVAGVVLIRKF